MLNYARMVETKDICWLAGLLEGEGCFMVKNGCPAISLYMTDRDTIEKAYNLMAVTSAIYTRNREHEVDRQNQFGFICTGTRAASWMMTLYSQMGLRRQAKIREILAVWRGRKGTPKNPQPRGIGVPRKLDGKHNPEYSRIYHQRKKAGWAAHA